MATVLALLACVAPARGSLEAAATFERYGQEHGLPHNTVTDILEDRLGFVWLATDDGAARFDGHEFVTFRVPPTSGLSNRIWSLAEEPDGTLWAGGSDGLYRLDRAAGELVPEPLVHLDGRPAVGVRSIVLDDRGAVWLSSRDGLFRRRDAGTAFSELPVEGEAEPALHFWAVAIDPAGTIWAKAGSGKLEPLELYRWRRDRFALVLRARPDVYHTNLTVDADGSLWLNGVDASGTGLPIRSLPGAAAGNPLTSGVDDGDGALWFGSFGALLRYDRRREVVDEIEYERSPTWHQRWIRSLHRDRAGGIWLATLAGVYRLDPQRKRFRHLGGDEPADGGLATGAVGGLAADRHGDLWIGTMGAGVYRLDARSDAIQREDADAICGRDVWSIYVDTEDRIWSGSESGLCVAVRGGGFRQVPLERDGDSPGVFTIAESPPGHLWLTTTALAVARLDVGSGEVRWFDEPRARGFGAWRRRGEHELWMGSSLGALLRVDTAAERIERFELVPAGERREFMIYDLVEAGPDAFWLATEAGLYRYRTDDRRGELVLASDSLPGSVVFSIQEDRSGRLWLGTNGGLARFDPRSAAAGAVRSYGLADGVGNLEFNRYSRLATADGELLFGGMTGLTRFRPEEIVDDPYPPPTVLSEVRVLDGRGARALAPELLDELVLESGSHAVTFLLAALDFSRPQANRYAYRLDGFDRAWIDGARQRAVRYTNLPPGRYVFRARSTNGDGIGGGREVALRVRVLPAFWQTTWFLLLTLGAGAAALGLVHRARVRRLLALQAVRLRIASDLHDELGSELAAIALSTSLVERDGALGERERRRLESARQATLRVMGGLRDIVWYVNPEHDRVASLAARMRSFADAALAGVEHGFEVEGDDGALDMHLRRQVYLIYKELVTNVARHAAAGRVAIRLAVGSARLHLTVADDGVGLGSGAGESGDGTGLASVRRRAAAIGARLELGEGDGGGTEARLDVPLGLTRTGHRRPAGNRIGSPSPRRDGRRPR